MLCFKFQVSSFQFLELTDLAGNRKLETGSNAVQREGVCTRMTSTTHWRQFIQEDKHNA